MKKNYITSSFKKILIFTIFFRTFFSFGQPTIKSVNSPNKFWEKVQFGGGLGLNFGSDFTEINIAPSAIYNFNQYASLGAGLQFGYLSSNSFTSTIYGGSIIGLLNPIPEIQFSAELEQLQTNTIYKTTDLKTNFWNTALYIGAGYRTGNITIGARYNILVNQNNRTNQITPFVRAYF